MTSDRRRESFDGAAANYNRYRSPYPDEVISEVVRASSIRTTESYVGWLKTDSLVLSLDDEARGGFLRDIGNLIDDKYDGSVARNFVYEVITARK